MEAILSYLTSIITDIIGRVGYSGVAFLMALESACMPVPSEVVMPYAGFLVSKGTFGFWQIVFWGTVGQMVGSIITYWVGATGGRGLLEKYGKYLLIKANHIEHADKWFDKYGHRVVFFGRVVPVIRTFISLPAGISAMPFTKFVIYSVLGIIPWTIMLTYLGVYLGENWHSLKTYFRGADVLIAATAVGVIGYYIYKTRKKKQANSS